MSRLLIWSVVIFILTSSVVYAAEDFKPYLHNPQVSEHPELKKYGEFQTALFSGAATFSYPIDVPKGVGDLQPIVSVSYSSQDSTSSSSSLGSGWSLNKNIMQRNLNYTFANLEDDYYELSLDGTLYKILFDGEMYYTEVNYYLKVENIKVEHVK